MMKKCSILNDVLGPVMTGPSSSHTAGPGKIGLAVRRLWGKPITAARVVYDTRGSYPGTHIGQGSDFGFAGGLQGMPADHPEFRDAIRLAQESGVRIRFEFADLGAHHPNEARIDILNEHGQAAVFSVLSFSTGGGTFLIPEMDGFRVSLDGQRAMQYLCCTAAAAQAVRHCLDEHGAVYASSRTDPSRTTFTGLLPADAVLFEVQAASLRQERLPEAVCSLPGILYVRACTPLVPVPLRLNPQAPFSTAAQALAYAESEGIGSMAELALRYECALGTLAEEDLFSGMEHVLSVMKQSMLPPPAQDPVKKLIAPMMSARLMEAGKLPFDMGVLNGCMSRAVAVMENSCAHRAVVAAPTAGASGIIPACVVEIGEKLSCSGGRILDALWAAGLVGSFIANGATFSAEEAGCQAEVGSAACMAAAGLVQLLGGSIRQGFHAAAFAMYSYLGLICDPVAGLTETPCIERNVTATGVSVMAANMALCGMAPLIPLDETIGTMLAVGKLLPDALRCTCKGGLCATPTGQELAAYVQKKQQSPSPQG